MEVLCKSCQGMDMFYKKRLRFINFSQLVKKILPFKKWNPKFKRVRPYSICWHNLCLFEFQFIHSFVECKKTWYIKISCRFQTFLPCFGRWWRKKKYYNNEFMSPRNKQLWTVYNFISQQLFRKARVNNKVKQNIVQIWNYFCEWRLFLESS